MRRVGLLFTVYKSFQGFVYSLSHCHILNSAVCVISRIKKAGKLFTKGQVCNCCSPLSPLCISLPPVPTAATLLSKTWDSNTVATTHPFLGLFFVFSRILEDFHSSTRSLEASSLKPTLHIMTWLAGKTQQKKEKTSYTLPYLEAELLTETTNTTFVIWSRPLILKCRTGGTTLSAALQGRRFFQAKPSLLMPLLVLLLGKMYLSSSSWVLKKSMDRSSADSLGILFQRLIALAVEKDLIFDNICLQFHLQQLLSSSPSSCHLIFLLLSIYSNSFFSVWKDLLDSKSEDSNHTGFVKIIGEEQ